MVDSGLFTQAHHHHFQLPEGEGTVRRIALIAAVALLATAATAYAVTNTLTYSVTLKKVGASKKPSAKKPLRLGYNALLHIDSDPAGNQPDTAPVTTIFFPKQIKQNAKLIPSCKQADIDGQASMPAKCNKAKVGTGTATALAGDPGSPAANSVKEDLNVTAVNGDGGKQILLVLNSQEGAPVAITNRVVPGDLGAGKDGFSYTVAFKIPDDLQNQLGLAISLTDFKVNITNKAFAVKKRVGGKKKTVPTGYLELVAPCPAGGVDIRAVASFRAKDGTMSDVTSDSKSKC
jgi:hypothetical protein